MRDPLGVRGFERSGDLQRPAAGFVERAAVRCSGAPSTYSITR